MRTNRSKMANNPPSLDPETDTGIIRSRLRKMLPPGLIGETDGLLAKVRTAGKAGEFTHRRAHPPVIENCEDHSHWQSNW